MGTPMPPTLPLTHATLEDYRAYEEELAVQLDGFARMRRQVRLFPVFAVITGVGVAIAWKLLFGVALAAIWLIFWGATLYITEMRGWQYKGERKRLLDEIAELQKEEEPTAVS